jgi:CRISPR-associated protein Csb2
MIEYSSPCDGRNFALQGQRWNHPLGSNGMLNYGTAGIPPPVKWRTRQALQTVEAALLALSSDSVRGNRLPLMTRAVRQTEFIHQSLVSILNKQLDVRDCSALTGRDARGRKLEDGHQHAHYFPLDLDGDRRIDHVLLYAPAGLNASAQQAVTRLRRTLTKGDDTAIFVTCAGFGDLDLFRNTLTDASGRPLSIIPPRPARYWISYTPYVPARHLKPKNNRYTLADDVRREIRLRGLPAPVRVELFHEQGSNGKRMLVNRQFFKFVRTRIDGKPQPPQPNVYGMRLIFDQPQPGPISLGYGSHFGLGIFSAEDGA